MADLPIVCSLTDTELATRRSGLLADLQAQVETVERRPDGLAFRFAASPGRLAFLAELIELERKCCRFLRIRLTVEPGGGPIWLELTGPEGTAEFLEAELGLGCRPLEAGHPAAANEDLRYSADQIFLDYDERER